MSEEEPARTRPSARRRRALGGLLLLLGLAGVGHQYHAATDFPTVDPVQRVDAALIERLRASPGLHVALAPEHELLVPLELEDDALNRRVYGTTVDLRERGAARRAIHIQFVGERGAIHADDHNPKAGLREWLLHGTVDVPVIPLGALALVGAWLLLGRPRRRG